ncbi:hypothetical protein CYLTODRAFT_415125 [Cylindrobasidium torrendii FP15055 ss-10]|uniref:Uncharacterized protein n=1 Tax=Cylindrobasidium torrendii FP15055 ss-10 TaxID=1314674 RepID=A0A0D7AUK2_9AGAR|nr:hypothetical protein CYLTODRAFT_415125 [Cylindrobasidium torrendii FP15055 ss-10]
MPQQGLGSLRNTSECFELNCSLQKTISTHGATKEVPFKGGEKDREETMGRSLLFKDKIKAKMQRAYQAARARYEREHDLPPKYSYTRPEPINFPQCSKKKCPSRVERELAGLKQHHDLWISTVTETPPQTQSVGEKIAQDAYMKLTAPADAVQATYYKLVELQGEGDASSLRAKAMHGEMSPSIDACLEMWGLCAEGEFPDTLEYAHEHKNLVFQSW